MGAGVSHWKLAQAVSRRGQLGVVSGTALDQILARRLQDGDPGGHMRRALDAFPVQAIARRILDKYYIPGGKPKSEPYLPLTMLTQKNTPELDELCIAANFVEVWLARQGHNNPVGINFLEKIQFAHLSAIYGSMLGGVDYIIMGAGIPLRIPGVIDAYVNHQPAEYPLAVRGVQPGDDFTMHFNPRQYLDADLPPLKRPRFLSIISSNTLAITMLKKANGRVDGFVVETPVAGGHNAPPRGAMQLSPSGEPIYGERDVVDLPRLRELNVPFWLAGGYGTPDMIRHALEQGAAGVQVGTAFAFSLESGLDPDIRRRLLASAVDGSARVFTDPLASPTGYPFKVALLENSASEASVFAARPRICDLGYLREPYRTPEGEVGYRCASEPVSIYESKGGALPETVGRKCVCNALLANIGMPQTRKGNRTEAALVTTGDDLVSIPQFLPPGQLEYTVSDVLKVLLPPGIEALRQPTVAFSV